MSGFFKRILFLDKGNTTTYEWTYGEVPLSVTEPSLNIDINEEVEENDEVSIFYKTI